ncbi:hypothetical protein RFI_17526 [Reticulomyxa filosa]|uniref:MCM N-terminal domain-containing protein n=1 Tax=Reticulomyxa filosa TaxID=46433 RepID=X6N1B6_RETFI|nr:hypothetical protein RFI_17526 [Reticulomyxa filosa]|eukprot:ETO19703.1 hypothetical protein RFI_17526 [Reticulomyxa filosa]
MSQQSNIASGDSAPSQDSEINNDNQNALESDNENKSENRASEPTTRIRRRHDNIFTAEQREVQGMALDSLAIRVRQQFQLFLEEYKDSDGKLYYVEQLKTMQSDQSLTLVVNWLHWRPEEQSEHSRYQDMADMIQSEYYRKKKLRSKQKQLLLTKKSDKANWKKKHKTNELKNKWYNT